MDEKPVNALLEIIALDLSFAKDSRRCRAMLNDRLKNEFRKEVNLLVYAIETRVTHVILEAIDKQSGVSLPQNALLVRALAKFEAETGLRPPESVWALEAWIRALNPNSTSDCPETTNLPQDFNISYQLSNPLSGITVPQDETALLEKEPDVNQKPDALDLLIESLLFEENEPVVIANPTISPIFIRKEWLRIGFYFVCVVGYILLTIALSDFKNLPDESTPPTKTDEKTLTIPETVIPVIETSAWIGKTAGERKVVKIGSVEIAFRWCPPGRFIMGSPENEEGHQKNEKQVYVNITKGFWIMETEVTQGHWEVIMGSRLVWRDTEGLGSRYPAYYVNYPDAEKFAFNFKDKLQKLYPDFNSLVKLPTEAQWEYACRAGTTTATAYGNSLSGNQANFDGRFPYGSVEKGLPLSKTSPVASFPANAWGIYDMHGNLWEWCADWYAEYSNEELTEPIGAKMGNNRVVRGGSWVSDASNCRSATRNAYSPYNQSNTYGFRMAIIPLQSSKSIPNAINSNSVPSLEQLQKPNNLSPNTDPTIVSNNKFQSTDNNDWESQIPGDRKVFRLERNEIVLRWCPPGSSFIGSPGYQNGRSEDEEQIQKIFTKGFWMMETEVTQGQWLEVMGTRPEQTFYGSGDDYPVYNVDYKQAKSFAEQLTMKLIELNQLPPGLHFKLPTEIQWEYACRAWTTTAYSFGDDRAELNSYAWQANNSGDIEFDSSRVWFESLEPRKDNYKKEILRLGCKAHPVAMKKSNPWGLHDMHGNVWEWCSNEYDKKIEGKSILSDTNSRNGIVIRGGGWDDFPESCRSANRHSLKSDSRESDLGFRLIVE